jgi:hypothetical protein
VHTDKQLTTHAHSSSCTNVRMQHLRHKTDCVCWMGDLSARMTHFSSAPPSLYSAAASERFPLSIVIETAAYMTEARQQCSVHDWCVHVMRTQANRHARTVPHKLHSSHKSHVRCSTCRKSDSLQSRVSRAVRPEAPRRCYGPGAAGLMDPRTATAL